jgi:glutamate dehydrogenase/leucine dehydrogenase
MCISIERELDAELFQNICMSSSLETILSTRSIKYNIKSNDLLKGANIAGFVKIADAMIAQGVI